MGRLAHLGLKDLPQDQLIALSRLLHYYFKAQRFPYRPLGVETFEPPLQTPYDYVLVDSRTGITEIGGLCVGPLADRLVVITGLNDQNVHGTLDFLKEAGIEPKPRSKDDEPRDDADPIRSAGSDHPSLGPKPTILVASPVPAGEITYKRQRLDELAKLLGIRPVSLSYHAQLALMESVFVRDYPEEYLADEYERFATNVTARSVTIRRAWLRRPASVERQERSGRHRWGLAIASQAPELGASLLGRWGGRRDSDGKHIPEVRQLYAFSPRIRTRDRSVEQLGHCALRPGQDEGGGGSRPALRGGGPQIRRGPPAEAGLSRGI